MKVAFYDTKPYDRDSFESKFKSAKISVKWLDTRLNEDSVLLAKGCDAVCVFVNDTINQYVIDKLTEYGVKLVALRCAGFNNVDITYAKARIDVVRVPSYSPYAIAEHAFALLLTLNRKIHKAYLRTRDYNFSLNGLTGFDLHGKTAGVIGTGKIGKAFINICKGFGMKVIAYDNHPDNTLEVEYKSLDDIYRESDILSFHCPLTDDTLHMFNKGTINKVKNNVIVINTSRGALINSEALLEGITTRKIAGACLDVYEEESGVFYEDHSANIPSDEILSLLISMPNVIVTSHQAFLTQEALANIAETTIANILEYKNTGNCINQVKL